MPPDTDVWFKFTATRYKPRSLCKSASSSFDAVVDVRGGACNGTTLANTDDYAAGGMETVPLYGLTVGVDYYVKVYHNKHRQVMQLFQLTLRLQFVLPHLVFYESFTGTTFPPTGWTSSNVSKSTTNCRL